MKVLVTGGSGFIGTNLKKVQPHWTYLGSNDCNLLDLRTTKECFINYAPDAIIHLAARVGGIKANIDMPAQFLYDNTQINLNVLEAARLAKVPRVLAASSTCAFPDKVTTYPFSEEALFEGPPTTTNFSYGYAKRLLVVQANSYRYQYGLNYSTFSISNIYGPGDHFSDLNAHFIPTLVKKVYEADFGQKLVLWGTGTPLRQQLYVEDLVNIIPILLNKHNTDHSIIVAPAENLSIQTMADIMNMISRKQLVIEFNQKFDGQYRKDGSNARLLSLCPEISFTPFEEGLKRTYNWYEKEKHK